MMPSLRYHLLALDVDGTLLDPQGVFRPRVAEALARAAEAGTRLVLCTGRRYRRARPVAEALGLDAPLVCNSGALVKDPAGDRTLWRADLGPELLAAILRLSAARGEPIVSFRDLDPDDLDFVIAGSPTGRPHFDEYVELNRPYARIDPDWTATTAESAHFHLCAVGTRAAMLEFQAAARAALADRVRTFVQKSPRYSGTMCEFLHPEASKWSAVLHLAALWGVAPEAICAIGDDMNDIPMIAGAGLGVAMAHAPAEVLDAADLVADDLAAVIEEVLQG